MSTIIWQGGREKQGGGDWGCYRLDLIPGEYATCFGVTTTATFTK